MKHIKYFVIVLFGLLALSLTSCGDQKSPRSGYLSEDEVLEIVNGFSTDSSISNVSIKGNLNYFNYPNEKVPNVADEEMVYVEYPSSTSTTTNKYLEECASYYLRLPLHITSQSWNDTDRLFQTKYQIESKIYRPAGLDKIYYYNRPEGGFIISVFGVNKELQINNVNLYMNDKVFDLVDLLCSGKWNINLEYDENGYLVKEEFATVNAPKNKEKASQSAKEKCCYGVATYEYY